MLDRFGLPAGSEPIVVARATTDADSGLDVVLNAAARCQAAAQSEPPGAAPLTILASAAEPNPLLDAQAARLGLEHFAQVQVRSGADWLALWQAADLALFPFRRPADGLDVLWALAAGTPAIVTAASGVDWLTDCPAVRTIADGDHELLADAMLEAFAGSWKEAQGSRGSRIRAPSSRDRCRSRARGRSLSQRAHRAFWAIAAALRGWAIPPMSTRRCDSSGGSSAVLLDSRIRSNDNCAAASNDCERSGQRVL